MIQDIWVPTGLMLLLLAAHLVQFWNYKQSANAISCTYSSVDNRIIIYWERRSFAREIISSGAPPARWLWGVMALGEWAVWRYVHLPSTQPGGGGSSPYCQRCWSRPRFAAAPPPPRCKKQQRSQKVPQVRTTLINTQDSTGNQSIASSFQRGRPPLLAARAFVNYLPVSVEGSMVKRRVSGAVHAIHIRASPHTVKKGRIFSLKPQHTAKKHSPALCKFSSCGCDWILFWLLSHCPSL